MAGEATGRQWAPLPASADDVVADFYSDMKSIPTKGMLDALLNARVGDVQKGEDPTTTELCQRVAEMLGKEAAILLPTGTMCNEISIRIHCASGSELIAERSSHIINFEAGGPAALSGVMMHSIDGEFGRFTAEQVRAAYRPVSRYAPETSLVAVEQTTNLGGGGIWSLEELGEIAETSKSLGLATHMDGARLLNACVETGVSAKQYATGYDSVWIDLTKGLGGFAGAVLAGTDDFINHAWRYAQQWGGGLRQSGYIAATGLYALDNNLEQLARDNALAKSIGAQIAPLPHISEVLPVETNIVIFNLDERGPDAATVVSKLRDQGVRLGVFGERTVRIVTHIGVGPEGGDLLIKRLRALLEE
ncbi:low specificity L-threonine aldolase 1 [Phaeobacter inhibens]|uniref:Low specificity L-threonine aldolase 1 n=1 Tax=Phaeobacter inhibens TaxID=221822 RepID=A0ABM6RB57_9RHOB|nr:MULTISPECIES: threonine aldolase family protein [Phaeobacter]AUQ49109.1 low specificity L-threonine aldolase 1 [Phaeobacter inhibens]AUQ93609.1 low specificity L-threonine aldolase 1 [Phaeobacter inhibens]AUR18912.1 low specificity L-threonine aldolase 1 [Phaeobacter inhibens]MBQ4808849.1 low specificity L-threonine aldolase [Phaeobacter sp. HS012]MBQ4883498.1 low specificity L-threonine aldolase [Phaeobacter sp. HS011]